MENYFFLKNYVTLEAAVSYNVLYYQQLSVACYQVSLYDYDNVGVEFDYVSLRETNVGQNAGLSFSGVDHERLSVVSDVQAKPRLASLGLPRGCHSGDRMRANRMISHPLLKQGTWG